MNSPRPQVESSYRVFSARPPCEHGDVRGLVFVLFFCWKADAASALLETRGEAKLTLPDRGEIRLFDFRPDSARGWKVSGASLLLFLSAGDVPKSLNISAVGAKWEESKPEAVAAQMFNKGQIHVCTVQPMEQGWVRVTLPPLLIESIADGKSHGLAIEQGPRKFNGRAPVYQQPYILVEGEPR
jgi:hypothetical protein